MFPKQHILRINETSNSAGKRATLHERGWRPCEPAQGGSCGILISSCGIKVRILGRQNFYMTPIAMRLLTIKVTQVMLLETMGARLGWTMWNFNRLLWN